MKKGKVYITGAGPGDEKLITLKALECLKKADVVIYDYLVNTAILKYCKKNCEKVYAGKKAKNHTMEQEVINEMIINYALKGKTVVRLKGGDPYVFGRGGEEALALSEKKIPFEIIPGVTAGVAVPAYAGIPVTHRDCGPMVTFITGHESIKRPELEINWSLLAKQPGTLVFYMGLTNISNITANLKENGLSSSTPVAVIRWGTTYRQHTICGTLENISLKVAESGIKPPALIIVGNSVKYRDKLQWFEQKKLFGKRILIAKSRMSPSAISQKLSDLGADIIEFPTNGNLQYLFSNPFDLTIFTSASAVKKLSETLQKSGLHDSLKQIKGISLDHETTMIAKELNVSIDLEAKTSNVIKTVLSFFNEKHE